jgi:metal-responsive CopG/Arc/MetJ family transcriptional regulator
MKKKILTEIIPIRLPKPVVKEIDRIAEKKYKNRSTLIREWIENRIKEEEK